MPHLPGRSDVYKAHTDLAANESFITDSLSTLTLIHTHTHTDTHTDRLIHTLMHWHYVTH